MPKTLTLSQDEFTQILDAIYGFSEEYAYRAEFASKRELLDEEDATYAAEADRLNALAETLNKRWNDA